MGINIIFLLIMLQILYRFGHARPVPVQHAPTPVQMERSNSTNNVPMERSNSTNNVPMERNNTMKNALMDATLLSQTFGNYSFKHIQRQKRAYPLRSTDIHTIHGPCEIDLWLYEETKFKFYCRDAYTNRFASKERYKTYRLYQMEGFTFGQHYERLRRFETEQHTFEYRGTGLLS